MNQILTFHVHDFAGNGLIMSPAYYLEDSCSPVSIKIYSSGVTVRDAEFDIYRNGVSIFANRNNDQLDPESGVRTYADSLTTVVLEEGQNSTELADAFASDEIEGKAWLTCEVVDGGGGRNITVQLEISDSIVE